MALAVGLPDWPIELMASASVQVQPSTSVLPSSAICLQLLLAATCIYWERIVRHLSGDSELLTHLLNDAFCILRQQRDQAEEMRIRQSPFAAFLLGAEARSEDERRLILDIMASSETGLLSYGAGVKVQAGYVSNMTITAELLTQFWVRKDLHNSSQPYFDYRKNLDEIVSSNETMPMFF